MVNTVLVNADQGRDFHPLPNHMTKWRNFTTGEIHSQNWLANWEGTFKMLYFIWSQKVLLEWNFRFTEKLRSSLDNTGSVLWRHRLSHTSSSGCRVYFSLWRKLSMRPDSVVASRERLHRTERWQWVTLRPRRGPHSLLNRFTKASECRISETNCSVSASQTNAQSSRFRHIQNFLFCWKVCKRAVSPIRLSFAFEKSPRKLWLRRHGSTVADSILCRRYLKRQQPISVIVEIYTIHSLHDFTFSATVVS